MDPELSYKLSYTKYVLNEIGYPHKDCSTGPDQISASVIETAAETWHHLHGFTTNSHHEHMYCQILVPISMKDCTDMRITKVDQIISENELQPLLILLVRSEVQIINN